MPFSEISLVAVFLTGLLGGVHCAGMCGGIVSALGMLQQRPLAGALNIPVRVVGTSPLLAQGVPASGVHEGGVPASAGPAGAVPAARARTAPLPSGSALGAVATYNAGRILTYSMLGALAGGAGSVAWLMESMLPVQQGAWFIGNLLLVFMGLYVMGFRRIGLYAESLGAGVWQRIRPAATARLSGSGFRNSLIAGSLWGLVPCGMVYAVLSAALVSGSWQKGALLMAVFGLGTLPNLMLLGLSGQWLARASRNRWLRRVAGGLIASFGLLGFLHLGMMLSGTHG